MIDFQTHPERYRHWRLTIAGPVATLTMSVDEDGGLLDGYQLKLNSYDLGVDIELYDAVQRLRFEHPGVGVVVLTSAQEKMFCAGANIRMLGVASHGHKVNFCKFTNETRNAIEEAGRESGQRYLCALNGTAAGGGYELALACDELIMIDDGSAAVSLPELPLLAVLPGTGGLTRLVDKRRVRRDRADFFCTTEEGVRGRRAVDWRLVDEVVPRSRFEQRIDERAAQLAAASDRPSGAAGVTLTPLAREFGDDRIDYSTLGVELLRDRRAAELRVRGPAADAPDSADALDDRFWPLRLARELDDAILHLRANEPELGTLLVKTCGDLDRVLGYDRLLAEGQDHWLLREVRLYWKRTLSRLELSSRSVIALIEPGSCFGGLLFELALIADQSFMLDGQFEDDATPPAEIALTPLNFGPLPVVTGWSRLQTRFYDDADALAELRRLQHQKLDAAAAERLGLVTFIPDDIDWQDEVRLCIESRASFSPDALTGMEASLRFPGPETVQSKIFARLSAWQNWIFQRPNAVGDGGALTLYGSGKRADFDHRRV